MFDDNGPPRSLAEIQALLHELTARIDAPETYWPSFDPHADSGQPHIEADGLYHFVIVERGEERERLSTPHLDELFYWIFQSVTFSMACAYELRHRKPGRDFRRILFANQLGLLATLDPKWAKRRSDELVRTLEQHPFAD